MTATKRYSVIVTVFSVLVFSLLVSGCTSLETYESSYFSVQYPSNWAIQQTSWESDDLSWKISPQKEGLVSLLGIEINVHPGESMVPLQMLCEYGVAGLEEIGLSCIDLSITSMGQWDCLKMCTNEVTGMEMYWAMKYERYYTANVMWFDFSYEFEEEYIKTMDECNQILNSIEFY